MKTIAPLHFPRRAQESGMAMISVLAVLFLVTLLVVAFMARTTSSRAAASSFHAAASTRMLTDTAVGIVEAQINEATTYGLVTSGGNVGHLSGSVGYTWGSQPGVIRVYGAPTALASGANNPSGLIAAYRLYSATPSNPATARMTTSLADLANDLPSGGSWANGNWAQCTSQWVDLNAFAQDSEGKYHFPIVDPRDPGTLASPTDPTVNPNQDSMIWNPTSGALPLKGFYINQPTSMVNTASPISPAAMPVRWLYILKDGSIVAPDNPATPATSNSPSNSLTFNDAVNASGASDIPSVKNPIVGRIAYWTDDETSKININTAGGDDVVRGTNPYPADSIYWGTPMFNTTDEVNMAVTPPANGEIQRYPGTPGTVGITSTVSALLGLTTPLTYNQVFGAFNYANSTPSLEGLTPRYVGGGSQSATVPVSWTGASTAYNEILAGYRLYNSIGEMLYTGGDPAAGLQTRAQSALFGVTPPSAATAAEETQAAAMVERAQFFLTAHSAAPELNLYGEPRVSIWPIHTVTGGQTANQVQTPIDQLIAFDSTLREPNSTQTQQFYFQRQDPTSSVTDCTIPNNESVLTYLDGLTSTAIPGFGNSFTAHKYINAGQTPPRMRQILAEIFDYVRTINLLDPALLAKSPSGVNYTYGQNWGLKTSRVEIPSTGMYRSGMGGTQVVPSANRGSGVNGWGAQGIGAFPIPVEVDFHFIALGTGHLAAKGGFPEVPEQTVPYQQYSAPNVAHDNLGTYDTFLPELYNPNYSPPTATDPENTATAPYIAEVQANAKLTVPLPYYPYSLPPDVVPAQSTPPYAGKPADWATAMQCFVYVNFINPAVFESRIQPGFCYSITGLNSLLMTDPVAGTKIPLHFPGNVANVSAASTGSLADEEAMVVDQSDGNGYINGWFGDWIFGYIPFWGEIGNNNYGGNPATLGPQQGNWGIGNNVQIAPKAINNVTGANWNGTASQQTVSGRSFPFYSQIFAISGVNAVAPTLNAPYTAADGDPNPGNTMTFTGGTIQIKMYDASGDGQTLTSNSGGSGTPSNQVSNVTVTIPSGVFYLPICSNANPRIVGCIGPSDSDRWHQGWDEDSGGNDYAKYITTNDVVQGVTLSPSWSDARDLAVYNLTSPTTVFRSHPLFGKSTAPTAMAHDIFIDSAAPIIGNTNTQYWGRLVNQVPNLTPSYSPTTNPSTSQGGGYDNYPIIPPQLNGSNGLALSGAGAYTSGGVPGDWDTGIAYYSDGPWINKTDEGAQVTNGQYDDATGQVDEAASLAYYSTGNTGQNVGLSANFSPNREVPSPVMVGSLPTGVSSTSAKPWQTLLFRPGYYMGGGGRHHPGEPYQPSGTATFPPDPADHLLLDLFWMPEAEPYPISQPLMTEGKINLNYEIQPFTYITRAVALRAVFAGTKVAVMPDSLAGNYKSGPQNSFSSSLTAAILASATGNMDVKGSTRLPIDPDQTMGLNPWGANGTYDPHLPTAGNASTDSAQTISSTIGIDNAWYDYVNKSTRFFKCPSEICEMFLVPQGYDWQDFTAFSGTQNTHSWYKIPSGDFALVGDNLRERPYADLYSRLTTKSNTYTVYYDVQSLHNAEPQVNSSGTTPGQQMWDENKGGVTGEYRGSTTIERYIDPNEGLPNFLGTGAVTPGTVSLEPYYKWRVLATRQFAP